MIVDVRVRVGLTGKVILQVVESFDNDPLKLPTPGAYVRDAKATDLVEIVRMGLISDPKNLQTIAEEKE